MVSDEFRRSRPTLEQSERYSSSAGRLDENRGVGGFRTKAEPFLCTLGTY